MRTSNEINEISKALMVFRDHLVQPKKDAVNPFFSTAAKQVKYAKLDAVVEAANAALKQANLTFIQPTTYVDGAVIIVTTILHESGQFISGDYLVDIGSIHEEKVKDGQLVKTTNTMSAQQRGAAVTYARRYALCAMLGIVGDEDDDGNGASACKKEPAPPPASAPVNDAIFEQDKKWLLQCADADSLKKYWAVVNGRKDNLSPAQLKELTNIKDSMKLKIEGKL